jgi:glycosyltransferase involved in cell wall biosynthesis
MPPKVTVLMSVFNGAEYLGEAIESILMQTFTDFDFIIIDDGSTDETWETLTEYAERDNRIALFQNQENIGLTRSLNKGLKFAQGSYIARQDADDISRSDRLQKQVACLDEHPEVALVSSNIEFIDSENRTLSRTQKNGDAHLVAWYLLFYNCLGGHSQVMFRREPVMRLGGYADTYRYSQDYELWLRLVNEGDIAILPDVLQQWRDHSENISFKVSTQQEALALAAARLSLRQLTGKEFSLLEVAELKGFWLARFPEIRRVRIVHSNLSTILGAFLHHRTREDFANPELVKNLRIIIGQQFLRWVEVLNTPSSILAKFAILLFAFAWSPPTTLGHCIGYIRKAPKDLATPSPDVS